MAKARKNMRILVHLPAYREPELIPTIKSALENAEYPDRIHFGICRQYNPEDGFDNVDEYRDDPRFKIKDIPYEEAKGLAYARAVINDELLTDEEFVCQLDSHHRFTENWDSTLIKWYYDLKKEGHNPLICGYLPYYNPFNDPAERVQEPWLSEAASFYPFGTIFIRPTGIPNWQQLEKPFPARFLSGHFAFGPNKWAKEVRHDPNIFFSGEEINLSVRSYTHGYDMFHPHRVIIWHATMREERAGKLVWDDQHKRGENQWWAQQDVARARIRQLFGVEDNGFNLEPYGLGTKRTVRDYEKYAGIHFKKKSFQKWTIDNKFPPNPYNYETDEEWENSFTYSFYHLVNIERYELPADDYTSILVAFDDEDGVGMYSTSVEGNDLQRFLNGDGPIHYEQMFMTDKKPTRVVYWGHSDKRGWAERVERIID
jgi:glycosyltransferase involved in cell wall biosynthesis